MVGMLQAIQSAYPHLSRHLPKESHVRRRCEENHGVWFPDKNIAKECRSLNDFFPTTIFSLNQERFLTIGQSEIFDKKQYLYDLIIDNTQSRERSLGIILHGVSMSKFDREKEDDFIITSILDIARK
jgi:hypothetical protein